MRGGLLGCKAHIAHELEPRCVPGHDEHRHGLVGRSVGVGDRHHDQEFGIARMRGEPLLAADHPVVALTHGAGLEHFGVGAALWLGHGEARDDLVIQERLQKAALLLGRAVVGKDLGIAAVGRLAAEYCGAILRAPQDFVEQGELDLAIALAAQFGAQMTGPQLAAAHLLL